MVKLWCRVGRRDEEQWWDTTIVSRGLNGAGLVRTAKVLIERKPFR